MRESLETLLPAIQTGIPEKWFNSHCDPCFSESIVDEVAELLAQLVVPQAVAKAIINTPRVFELMVAAILQVADSRANHRPLIVAAMRVAPSIIFGWLSDYRSVALAQQYPV